MVSNKTKMTAAVAVVAVASQASAAKDARCIHQALPEQWIRVWDLELGETSLSKVGGLPCDKGWYSISKNDKGSRTGVTNSVGNLLIEQIMDDLQSMGSNGNADAYYCPDGIQWYSVNSFDGCNAKDGTKLTLKGKTYQNDDTSWVQSIRATVSYVCTHQARRRDIGVSYSAVVSNDVCSGPITN